MEVNEDIIKILDAGAKMSAEINNTVMKRMVDSLEFANAKIRLIEQRVMYTLSGDYMPTPNKIIQELFVSDEDVKLYIEDHPEIDFTEGHSPLRSNNDS